MRDRETPHPRLFVIDHEPAIRAALDPVLESVQLEASYFSSAEAFLDALEPGARGCVLCALRLPGMSGLDLQAELARRETGLPIILLTSHGDVPTAVCAMRAGAVDFIEKPFAAQQLLDSIGEALQRSKDQHANESFLRSLEERLERLTPREREVMHLVAVGLANKEVARYMHISTKTVEMHRGRVMTKLEARSVADLVRMWCATRNRCAAAVRYLSHLVRS